MFRKIKSLFTKTEKVAETSPDSKNVMPHVDPLEVTRPIGRSDWPTQASEVKFVKAEDYPQHVPDYAMDGAVVTGVATDDADVTKPMSPNDANALNPALFQWYMSQGFIGYQACAIIAQHWLVDKACSQAGEDAIRNGWKIKATGEETELSKEDHDRLTGKDIQFKLKENLAEFNRFKNIFGIRVALFEVESDDPKYYEKPFNIDGVTKDSYKGISQIDPYWMTPMLTANSTGNPAGRHFYEPDYWIISGQKYHRSHLVIARGPQPADILKPTYIFGGIPLTQRIFERVYAAERTANEAPLLAMSKRTTTLHVDVAKAMLNQGEFEQKLAFWTKYRDNHAVKVLGLKEEMDQFDTSLSDFDSIIMNQYQLVSAIAKTPSTKLLGTSPKGFSATGEFEMLSYHEELESIHSHVMLPLAERHYLLMARSEGIEVQISVVFEPVDSVTTQQQADLNDKKADTDQKYVTMGAISPDEVRGRLRDDKHSGYNRLTDDDANETPGMSPENLAAFEKAGAESDKAGAEQVAAAQPGASPGGIKSDAGSEPGSVPALAAPKPETKDEESNNVITDLIAALNAQLDLIGDKYHPEGVDLQYDDAPGLERTTKPGTSGIVASVGGANKVVNEKETDDLPRIKINGMVARVENPRGSIRQGKNGNWKVKMPHHYGFIAGTKGADGEEVDCFIGRNLQSRKVFIINQINLDKQFDEHKVMLGFDNPRQAAKGYNSSFKPGWDGLGSMAEVDFETFKAWLANGDTTQPYPVMSANSGV